MTGSSPYPAEARFLTIFEAAAIMRVSKQTVYRLVRARDLEAIKVSGSYRIPDQALSRLAVSPSP